MKGNIISKKKMKGRDLIEKKLKVNSYFGYLNLLSLKFRKKKKKKSENLIFQGSVTRKFNRFSRVRASRFNYKLFLKNQQYFRQWFKKRKARVYEMKKLSRSLLKKASNKKLSLSYYMTKYLSLDLSIFFASQGFVKNLNESKLLVGLKQIELKKDFGLIKKKKSLENLVFRVTPSVSEILLGSHLRRREEKVKFSYLINLHQNLMWKYLFKESSYGFREKGFFQWPLVSHILGVRNRKRVEDSFFFKKVEVLRGLSWKGDKKSWFFQRLLKVESLKDLKGLGLGFLNILFFKELKRNKNFSGSKALETRGLVLSRLEKEKKLISKLLDLESFQKKKLLRLKKEIKLDGKSLKGSFSRNLKKLLWKKRKLKITFEKCFLVYFLLKLKGEKLKGKKERKYFSLYKKGKHFRFSLRKRLWIKKYKWNQLLKKETVKRKKIHKDYNFASRISPSFEVNYKTLSIYHLGKFSQIGGRTFGSLPLNLGALSTRLTY